MGEVIHATGHDAEKFVVTRAQGAKAWRVAQVPFADQRGGVACITQQGGQCGHVGRQPQRCAAFAAAVDGLFHAAAQAVLVAHGHQREAGWRAHGRVGITLGEPHATGGQCVYMGRDRAEWRVAPTVAAQVGVAQVVRHDIDDVGFHDDEGKSAALRRGFEKQTVK